MLCSPSPKTQSSDAGVSQSLTATPRSSQAAWSGCGTTPTPSEPIEPNIALPIRLEWIWCLGMVVGAVLGLLLGNELGKRNERKRGDQVIDILLEEIRRLKGVGPDGPGLILWRLEK